jgi:hypothetical protein
MEFASLLKCFLYQKTYTVKSNNKSALWRCTTKRKLSFKCVIEKKNAWGGYRSPKTMHSLRIWISRELDINLTTEEWCICTPQG